MRYLVGFFAVVGILAVLILSVAIWAVSQVPARKPVAAIPPGSVLVIDLKTKLSDETGSPFPIALPIPLPDRQGRLREIVAAVDRARRDDRVRGIVVHLLAEQQGLTQAQELRDAIRRFRGAGKFAVAYADTYGEGDQGNAPYYLASGFDEVWLQPMGQVGLVGYGNDFVFLRGALDKAGVGFEVIKRKEYKTAADMFSEPGLSPAAREMYKSLYEDVTQQLVDGVAEGRRLPADTVRRLMVRGPLTSDEALAEKLVDKVGYMDQADEAARLRAGAGSRLVTYNDWRQQPASKPDPAATRIAMIYASGEIRRTTGADFSSDPVLGPERMRRAFDEAIADGAVKAILLRVDSPGGSVVASETIRRDVQRAQAAGKKVVVSMGALAGSGGYYIAMDADRIVAQPATLTGSIGVVMQKPNAAGLMARLGIQVETVAAADTQPLSLYRPFTDAQRQRYEERIDWTYNSFVQAVAAGRKLSPERAEQLAKGRVWTGRQAKELGLVDALGGIDVALRETRSVLGLAADAPVAVRLLPRQRSTFDEVLRFARGETNAELGQLGQGLQVLRLLAQVAAPVLRGTDETMRMDEGLVAP